MQEEAREDLDKLRSYLDTFPAVPAEKIAPQLKSTLSSIAEYPCLGRSNSALTQALGREVRARSVAGYRILYVIRGAIPEMIGVLHGAHDAEAVLTRRRDPQ
jgi:plasmid stabilization system protein ParE